MEILSPSYRKVIGFWQHVVEKRVNLTLKTDASATTRAPSLIVYTPSGYVGVYFPRGERDMLDQAPKNQGPRTEVAVSSRQSPDGAPTSAANRFVSFPPPL